MRRTTIPRSLPVGGSPSLPFTTRLGSTAGAQGSDGAAAARGGTLSPLRTSLALGNRPLSAAAAGRPGSAAAVGAGEGAGGSGTGGRTSLSVPLRRFAASSRPSTAPAGETTVAGATGAASVGPAGLASSDAEALPVTAASPGDAVTVGGSRRISGGWFAAAEGGSSPVRSAAVSEAVEAAAQAASPQQPPGLPDPDGTVREAGGVNQGASSVVDRGAVGSAVGSSPARLGSMRRTRVSDQER